MRSPSGGRELKAGDPVICWQQHTIGPKTPVFGQPTHPTCGFVDSDTCKASGEGDFGQLNLLADVADTRCDLPDS